MKLSATILTLLLGGMTIHAAGQGNYTVDVQFKNIPDSVQFTLASNEDDTNYKQKVRTLDNRLHFEIDIAEDYPTEFYLIGKNPADPKNDRFYITFYGRKGLRHTITSAAEGFSADSVTYAGAPWDASVNELDAFRIDSNRRRRQLREERDKLLAPFDVNDPTQPIEIDSITRVKLNEKAEQIMAVQDEYMAKLHDYVMQHPESPESLSLLEFRYTDFNRDEINSIVSRIPAYMNGSPRLDLVNLIKTSPRITVGDRLADFDLTGENFDGSKISLSQFSTPYIIVEFNSFGCGACRSAAKYELPGFLEKYGEDVTFVSYSVDEKREQMERAHNLDNATWPSIWNGSGSRSGDCVKYGVTGYPHFFLFGPDRTLMATWIGWGPEIIERQYKKATNTTE
ncbi:MAG: hypothetical protein HDR85_06710 [Bacteroides sp.]|nr:hypothetical protein [Bacteroides sp.]